VVFDEKGGESLLLNAHNPEDFDAIVISPGFPATHPWRQWAEASGKPCLGETDYAARHWQGKIFGVTGTNGKTSLTMLLTSACQQAGVEAVATGNIGAPLAEAACMELNTAAAVAVCELSSFQAELSEELELDALIWTNFSSDHLDRYSTKEDYFRAKWRLVECLKAGSPFIYGPEVAAAMNTYGVEASGRLVDLEGLKIDELNTDSPFRHPPQNENLALAEALWEELNQDVAKIYTAANTLKLPDYRLQAVTERDGVKFWNDSKATNFHAVRAALAAMPAGPVIWVGGGREKGEPAKELAAYLKGRVAQACVYGESGPALKAALEAFGVSVFYANECEASIQEAARLAAVLAPAQVLFSPGFASFDAFTSYIERGKCFNSVVLSL
jgi:UDP-N-acetylmuramoylalanine--D-glutamate ligase